MKYKRSCWSLLVVMFALLIAVPGDAFGRPRSSSRSSRPRSTAKRTTTKAKPKAAAPKRGAKTGKASKQSSWGSSNKKAGKSKKATKADKKAYEKAKAQGTTFKTRKAATADYKKKNAAKYTSTYTTKPAARPGHIPKTYASGGTMYNISYNSGYGGYGYMGPLGAWIVYDAMADVAMASYYNRQMAQAGYYYGAPPVYGMRTGTIMGIVAGIVLIFVIGAVVMGRSEGG